MNIQRLWFTWNSFLKSRYFQLYLESGVKFCILQVKSGQIECARLFSNAKFLGKYKLKYEFMEKGETDAFSEPFQTSKMVRLAKIVNSFTVHLKYLTGFWMQLWEKVESLNEWGYLKKYEQKTLHKVTTEARVLYQYQDVSKKSFENLFGNITDS